jgi:hypothetical protein
VQQTRTWRHGRDDELDVTCRDGRGVTASVDVARLIETPRATEALDA